jgi:hypothetical protein
MKNEPFFKFVAAAIFAGVVLAFGNLSTDATTLSSTKPERLAVGMLNPLSAKS